MSEFEKKMLTALVNYGAAQEDWKVKIIDVSQRDKDIEIVELYIIKKRCRKPCVWWKIPVDTVRGLAFFDKAKHEYL